MEAGRGGEEAGRELVVIVVCVCTVHVARSSKSCETCLLK
jgi:hypothetical protein